MKDRCYNKNHEAYHRYGGRGITVCDRWRNDFEKFYIDMGEVPVGLQLNRKENDGPYSPDNCEWTTAIDNSNNKSNNLMITIGGKTQTATQWAREAGLGRAVVWKRYKAGYSGYDLIAARSLHGDGLKRRSNRTMLTINGETKLLTDWAAETGIGVATIHNRMKYGYSGSDLISKEDLRARYRGVNKLSPAGAKAISDATRKRHAERRAAQVKS